MINMFGTFRELQDPSNVARQKKNNLGLSSYYCNTLLCYSMGVLAQNLPKVWKHWRNSLTFCYVHTT